MLEFHRNRFEVILEQEDAYKTFSTSITKIEDELKSKSRHPFLDNDLQIKFIEVLNAVKADLNKSEKKYAKYQNNDEIYDELDLIFNKNIGLPYDDKELCEIYKEGQDRYVNKIPPGYEDEKDKKDNKKWKKMFQRNSFQKKPLSFY